MMTTTETFDEVALAALIAAATVLGTDVKMGLNTAIIAPSKTLTLSDMVEPTFTGYVQQSVVFGTPFRDPTYEICSLAAPLTFQEITTPASALIQGWFITYGTGPAKLLAYEALSTPFQFNDLLDALTIAVQYVQSSQQAGFGNVLG